MGEQDLRVDMSSCQQGSLLAECRAWPRELCRLRAQELFGSACCAVVGLGCGVLVSEETSMTIGSKSSKHTETA